MFFILEVVTFTLLGLLTFFLRKYFPSIPEILPLAIVTSYPTLKIFLLSLNLMVNVCIQNL